MAVEEVIKDEYSDENFAPEGEAALLGEAKNVQLGDAFRKTDVDSFEVGYNQKERLKNEALEILPTLKKENEILKADNAKYKIDLEGKALPPPDKLIDIDTSSLSSFTTSVGESFMNLAKEVPNKIEEISKDPKKKRNFMRGLEIIEASSGIKPIGQAKSTVGAISQGLLKAEKGFIATDIAKLKAQKKEPRRYESGPEKLLYSTMEKYKEKITDNRKSSKAVFEKYNLARKVALKEGQLPTGIFNATFAPLKKFIQEAGLSSEYDALAAKFLDKDYKQMSLEDQNQFNDLFQAATFQQVVQEVKLLYPVSNKDIDTLLKTKGDISSNPEALRYLIAGQMAVSEIAKGAENFAYQYFELGDQQFETKALQMSEKQIADKLRKDVSSVTLEKMFGSAEGVTDAGVIAAYYYQQLEAQKPKAGEADPYKIFQKSKEALEKEKQDIIDKYDPEKNKTDT